MAIQQVSREFVDRLLPDRHAIDRFIGPEVEWLADPVGNIIGIIAEGAGSSDWGYAVLRRDEAGGYRIWDLQTRIDGRDTARLQIVPTMEVTQPNSRNCSPLVG
jgi:hypothetical protein